MNCPMLLLMGVLPSLAVQMARAESRANPYQAIVERNPFGLKPPPPPPDPTPPAPAVPPGKVILTGISSIFGVRALLEITEQEPGKSTTTRKPILKEGERDGSVEVISVDVEKSVVKIRNAGQEATIAFEAPKPSGGGAPASVVPAGFPPAAATTPGPGASAIYVPPGTAPNPGRNSGVTAFGNSDSSAVTSFGGNGGSFGGSGSASPSTYDGLGVGTAPGGATLGGTALADNTGLRSIPSRSLRTDTPAPGVAPVPIDPAKQYLQMAIDHEIGSAGGTRPYPPLPPAPP